ncbi:hypothetical protein THAOC_15810 [Thalassiosira oceanica]|uniref:Uncharacterized protein n=1 Tax=Thalassiosira oceanica TaxID=159749 RepID=K0SR43_THAOC|nr:hypothetical protein THAOC_15810 [Thalassiosira oceanica]|eukprot:EJK63526.1 hypothetical protein THAOC_15810 [Thalassiosira oceanica]
MPTSQKNDSVRSLAHATPVAEPGQEVALAKIICRPQPPRPGREIVVSDPSLSLEYNIQARTTDTRAPSDCRFTRLYFTHLAYLTYGVASAVPFYVVWYLYLPARSNKIKGQLSGVCPLFCT